MNLKLPNFFKDPHALVQKEHNMPILLGLSGGADSSALLFLLCMLRDRTKFPLYAAHINHNIRTENYDNEAQRDEDFCRAICQKLGVELFVASIDVPSLALASGNSIETEAREARYRYFAEIMKEKGIEILVTAHNADDNLETQIFNLCRGCGVSGICGIPEIRPLAEPHGSVAVRPILGAKKAEILQFCADNSISYITDSTNFENDCTRNRIRNIIIPELNSIFGSPQSAALRLSVAAREDNDHILSEACAFLGDRTAIPLRELNLLSPPVAKRVLMCAFEAQTDANLEWVHIDAILDFARSHKNGMLSLPSHSCAVFESGTLCFKHQCDIDKSKAEYNISIIDDITPIPMTDFAIMLHKSLPCLESITLGGDSYALYSHATMKGIDITKLSARSRAEGEVILDGGMHKRIKKLMCDKKIPKHLRNMPIIHENGEAVYVPMCAVSDRARAKKTDFDIVISVYLKNS